MLFTKHFVKRLFYFVLIIAFGALVTLVVNYIQNKDIPAPSGQFDY